MNVFKKVLAGLTLSASFLVATGARAMPIPQFDKMTNAQAGEYTYFLIESAANILANQGDTAGAAKVRNLFESAPGQGGKPALANFFKNLNGVRDLNQQHASDAGFKPFEVEHALSLTLKQNGILVPVSKLLQVSQTYKPTAPSGSLAAKVKSASPSNSGGQ